jgi:hypothetical protein
MNWEEECRALRQEVRELRGLLHRHVDMATVDETTGADATYTKTFKSLISETRACLEQH